MKTLNEYPAPETDSHIRGLIRNPEVSGCNRTLTFAHDLEQRLAMCRDALAESSKFWQAVALHYGAGHLAASAERESIKIRDEALDQTK